MESADFSLFRRQLSRWYLGAARDLPWRRTTNAYRIWISEIMLQQTTVAAVIPYFQRFMQRFPDVFQLAQAEESEVLRYWEGLGYYSRARNIHRAAKIVAQDLAGRFPSDPQQLQELPGIGRYTAGAIASFAFDRPAPIVEANTLRLYCRLLGYDGDPRSKEGQQLLWGFAESLLPRKSPGKINQALMELGATLCTPRDPDCKNCPVSEHCKACQAGRQSEIPRPKPKVRITEISEVFIAIRKSAKYLLRRRTANERWAGLWDFIRFEIEHDAATLPLEMMTQSVLEQTGLSVELGPQIAEFKHGVTRYRITLKCLIATCLAGKLKPDQEWQWIEASELSHVPLSVTGRQFADRLHGSLLSNVTDSAW